MLEAVSGRSRDELLDLLDEALAARVLTDLPGSRTGLRFSHALIRDSLYSELGRRERMRLHRRAAEALELVYGAAREPHLAELAYHTFEAAPAGDVRRAIDYARQAAERAADLVAYEEAARHYEMALDALALEPDPDEALRCELLLGLGDAQARGGDTAAWKDTFAGAADIARAISASEQLARAALGYGGRFVWFRAGSDRRLIPLLEDALGALSRDHPLRARLLARLAGALRDQPVAERRAELCREAVELARGLDDAARWRTRSRARTRRSPGRATSTRGWRWPPSSLASAPRPTTRRTPSADTSTPGARRWCAATSRRRTPSWRRWPSSRVRCASPPSSGASGCRGRRAPCSTDASRRPSA